MIPLSDNTDYEDDSDQKGLFMQHLPYSFHYHDPIGVYLLLISTFCSIFLSLAACHPEFVL